MGQVDEIILTPKERKKGRTEGRRSRKVGHVVPPKIIIIIKLSIDNRKFHQSNQQVPQFIT